MPLYNYIEEGGFIMYILLVMSMLGISIMLYKAIIISVAKMKQEQLLRQIYEKITQDDFTQQHLLERCFTEEINTQLLKLENGLNLVRVIASVSPLLGLLGTVIGILASFKMISLAGMDNPTLFAEGISVALITTAGGLIVSIPHYIGYSCLTGAIDRLESAWNKEAAFLLKSDGKK